MKKIVVLSSGGASSLVYLKNNDPNFGVNYKIVCCVSNKKGTKGEVFCKENDIPFEEVNLKDFVKQDFIKKVYGNLKIKDIPDNVRYLYFVDLSYLICKLYKADLVMLSGFMVRITPPLLGDIPIINVHPADLSLKDEKGLPIYRGDDAVTLAIEAGEKYTASTIHVVTKDVDCGEIICISEQLVVEDGVDPKDHQEKMKAYCDGPAYQKALDMICNGEFLFK